MAEKKKKKKKKEKYTDTKTGIFTEVPENSIPSRVGCRHFDKLRLILIQLYVSIVILVF